jgi:chaperonin GroES
LKVLTGWSKEVAGKLRRASVQLKTSGLGGGSAMKFRPLHDRVVVRRIEEDERTPGGIIIPDTAKEKPQQGEVIAAGPGARDEKGVVQPLDVKAGDRVLFGKWSGSEVKIDGEELLIMKESDILGVLEGAAASKKKAA